MAKYVENEWMQSWSCGECGIRMAVALSAWEGRQKSGKGFSCFNGHSRVFRETEEQKLQRALDREKQVREAAEARAATAEADRQNVTKAHKKMRARVMNGVCPCCNRTFQNLMAHMKTEHADFAEKQTLATLRQAFGMTQRAVAEEAGVKASYVSLYETGRSPPEYARKRIDGWMARHQATLP